MKKKKKRIIIKNASLNFPERDRLRWPLGTFRFSDYKNDIEHAGATF